MPTHFRPATIKDVSTLAGLIREFYTLEAYPYDEATIRRAVTMLVGQPVYGRIWLIEVDGETAGHLVLTLGYSLEFGGRDAFVDELFLRPVFRGKGIGAQALEVAEAACRELGVRALHLEVEHHNSAGQALYRKRGFASHNRHLMTRRITPLGLN